ncbi:MAG: 2,3,4,5-tetrahydropyridine-2,6-dicarboxylate N-succinyltransferase, partial [Pseudomonadota bacterium]
MIDHAWENRAAFTPANAPQDVRSAVAEVMDLLDSGKMRVAEKIDGNWTVNQW